MRLGGSFGIINAVKVTNLKIAPKLGLNQSRKNASIAEIEKTHSSWQVLRRFE